jgi:alcohol dehydrogenase class IV
VQAIQRLASALPRIVARADDLDARADALAGAWLAGTCLASVGMGLHHKHCHVLGGSFDLPHAETHTVVLPYATAYNSVAAPEAMQRVARALGGVADPARALQDLAKRLGAPSALKDIGMQAADLDRAAELATQNPYYNPRPVTREGVRALLEEAYHGRPPAA